ncbi:hypothetical protein BC829DRAFT_283490 [Chytridium lagenaria]|nr:hypothetical protein BC829DRAFT_283490 [Chytridium lagenaria]
MHSSIVFIIFFFYIIIIIIIILYIIITTTLFFQVHWPRSFTVSLFPLHHTQQHLRRDHHLLFQLPFFFSTHHPNHAQIHPRQTTKKLVKLKNHHHHHSPRSRSSDSLRKASSSSSCDQVLTSPIKRIPPTRARTMSMGNPSAPNTPCPIDSTPTRKSLDSSISNYSHATTHRDASSSSFAQQRHWNYGTLSHLPGTHIGFLDKLSTASPPRTPTSPIATTATTLRWRRRLVILAGPRLYLFHATRCQPSDLPLSALTLGPGSTVALGPEEGMLMVGSVMTGEEWVLRAPSGRIEAEAWARLVRDSIVLAKSVVTREVINRANMGMRLLLPLPLQWQRQPLDRVIHLVVVVVALLLLLLDMEAVVLVVLDPLCLQRQWQ